VDTGESGPIVVLLHEQVKLQAEFLEALDLGLFQVTACEYPERIARLVITSCEAFDNIPPGLPGHTLDLATKVPGGLFALVQPLRRLPLVLGCMAKRPIPTRSPTPG
jgi:hypothetical protein